MCLCLFCACEYLCERDKELLLGVILTSNRSNLYCVSDVVSHLPASCSINHFETPELLN